MRTIRELKYDMRYVRMALNAIEKNGFLDKEFTASELGEKWYVASHNSQLMMMLVRRGIAEIVGTVDRTFEKEIWHHNKYVKAQIPYKANVYRIIHDAEWYKNVLLKVVANAIA